MIYIHFHFKGNTSRRDKTEILKLLKFTTDEVGFLMRDGEYLLATDGYPVKEYEVLALVGNKNGTGMVAITDLSKFESDDESDNILKESD